MLSLYCVASPRAQPGVQVDGHVWFGATPLCALVLANGQSTFSCEPDGPFALQDVPLDADGQIDVQVFASGFAPFRQTVTPTQASSLASLPLVDMVRAENGRAIEVTERFVPLLSQGKVRVSGSVSSEDSPLCALILANGHTMFSCDKNLGEYSLDVPLDGDGAVTLMAFAAGFQPYRSVTPIDLDSVLDDGECLDLADTWRVIENVNLTCRLSNGTESLDEDGSATVDLQQDGCGIRIVEPVTGTPRTGTIRGNRVTLSGRFVLSSPEVQVTENTITFEQMVFNDNDFTLIGAGSYTGSRNGETFRCDGATSSRFIRLP